MAMKRLAIFLLLAAGCWSVSAQSDTTVYKVAEEMPRFPGCEQLDTTAAAKAACAQQQLLSFVYGNIIYPMEARQNGNEGQVVVSFVVEQDGSLSSPRILKDIGGGCGLEVLRVINLMNEMNVRWTPGRIGGKVVRTNFNLPVRFKLEEEPPFAVVQGDTVYTRFDEPLSYIGGDEALIKWLQEKIDYPPSGNDSCLIGTIDVQILVRANGDVRIFDLTDFANLGNDFWYEAIDASTSTLGKWKPAVYEGHPVPATYDLTLYFEPTAPSCKTVIDNFKRATDLANEGSQLFNDGKQDEGLEKMTEAVALFPNNANFLFLRGQAYLDMNRLEEACADLSRARGIALNDWYSGVLPIICR